MKKISEIILSYVESIDEKQILKHENNLLYRIYFPILLLGALLYYISFTSEQNLIYTVINILFFIATSLCFLILGRFGKNEIVKVHVFNVLLSLTLTYFYFKHYSHIGPAVWTVSFILIVISIIRIHKSTLIVISITVCLLGMYTWYKGEPFELNFTYYISQVILYALLFLISSIAHGVNKQSKDKILEQLQIIKSSKKFMEKVNDRLAEVNAALEEEIQEHIITQRDLIESEEKSRAIFEGSADPVLIMKDGKIINCNLATVKILDYHTKQSIIGKALWEISPAIQPNGDNSKESISHILEKLDKKENMRLEWWHTKRNGMDFVVEIMLTPFLLDGECTIHILWRDISARKQLEEKLVFLSYHDQLTGLFNRRYFEEELRRLDTSRNLPISLVFADVNNLKQINDTFGHYKGDELLKNISGILKNECRADDIIARLGGDEFVIVLPKTEAEVAQIIIDRLKSMISIENINGIALSVAFGLATKEEEEHAIYEVLNRAETYMYKNKLLRK